jgi:sugar/nucleoside kinase (ribokinase family)
MPRVIGVGDNVVDKYLHTGIMYPGGNALNFAVFAKKAGVDAAYLGSFGNDRAADHIQSVLQGLSIDISRCRRFEGENGFARVTLVDGNRVFVPGNAGGVMRLYPLEFSSGDLAYIRTFQLAHSSCYSYIEPQLQRLKGTGVPLSYDFSSRIGDEYLRAVCPFVDFAFFSAEESSDEASIVRTIETMHRLGCTVGAATRGKKGAILLYRGRLYHQTAEPKTAVDTMGAGDSFLTVFLLHFLASCGWQASRLLDCSEAAVRAGLQKAARAAAETCGVGGSFGFGVPFSQ